MRTTLTLEPAVAERLKREAAQTERSFKEVVNDALKRGLNMAPPKKRKPFKVKPIQSAYHGGVDRMSFNRLADELEIEAWIAKHGPPAPESK